MRIRMSVICVGLCLATQLTAQQRGNLSGRITDPANDVIAGAKLTLTNKQTSVTFSTTSNTEGIYRFEYLDPGSYQLTASTAGFKTTFRDTALRTGEQQVIDLSLELGAVTEKVEVRAEIPLLETSSGSLGQVIENRFVTSIPLAVGNPLIVIKLAPGANPTRASALQYDEPAFEELFGYKFYGTPVGTTSFTLNGINNTLAEFGGQRNSANLQPPVEAVQEFKITQSYDAALGHSSGTSVDISLKQGGKALHGTGYGFLRDSSLDANSFFNNKAGNPKTDSDYHRIGFALNGPIYLPKAKDKAFFSYSYENARELVNDQRYTNTVPTAAELKGDFSQLLQLGPEYQIYDPRSTTLIGDTYTRTPVPNNDLLSLGPLNPISLALAQYWPAPNLPGGADGSNNYQAGTASPTDWTMHFARVDYTLAQNHRLFVQYGLMSAKSVWANNYDTLASGLWQTIRRQTGGLDYVWVLNPGTLLNVRYGYTRVADPLQSRSRLDAPGNPFGSGYDISTLGLAPSMLSALDLTKSALPHIYLANYDGLHDNERAFVENASAHGGEATLQFNPHRHNVKVGTDYRLLLFNEADDTEAMPSYSFASDYTNSGATDAPSARGQDLAAFLLGVPSGGSIRRGANYAARNTSVGAFFQDNWRLTNKLTINLGLRFEYYGAITERYDRSVRGFAYGVSSPIEAAAVAAYAADPMDGLPVDQFRVTGGLLYPGADGQPRSLYDVPAFPIAPRVGFAYKVTNKTVLRGGYGLFYIPTGLDGGSAGGKNYLPIQTGYSRSTSLESSPDNGITYTASMENPFPNGVLEPLGAAGGLTNALGQGISFYKTDGLKLPYMQRVSLTVQQVLPGSILLEASFVGSRGTHLTLRRPINGLPNQYLSTANSRDTATINYLNQLVTNPFSGLIPGSSLNANVVERAQLLRPYPHFTSVAVNTNDQGYSTYRSLEARAEKRFSQGIASIVSYSWSREVNAMDYLNPMDPVPHAAISVDDAPHILSVATSYELPFGKRKRFGANLPKLASGIFSGWQSTFVWSYLSGWPLRFSNDAFTTGESLALSGDAQSVDRWFNTAAFVTGPGEQPSFHLRTLPLRFGNVRSGPINSWDISVMKDTQLSEKANIQFFAQFLNAFNHPTFGRANTNPSSGSFGFVEENTTWPRRIQFGLKFLF